MTEDEYKDREKLHFKAFIRASNSAAEWKDAHEALLEVRQQDIAALTARAVRAETAYRDLTNQYLALRQPPADGPKAWLCHCDDPFLHPDERTRYFGNAVSAEIYAADGDWTITPLYAHPVVQPSADVEGWAGEEVTTALEMSVGIIQDMVRRHPDVLQDLDASAFILNILNPALVTSRRTERHILSLQQIIERRTVEPPADVNGIAEIKRWQAIEHFAWHLLDDSEQRGEEVAFDIDDNYRTLSNLLTEEHPHFFVTDRIAELGALLPPPADVAHSDHPSRHYDRTCPACNEPDVVGLIERLQHGRPGNYIELQAADALAAKAVELAEYKMVARRLQEECEREVAKNFAQATRIAELEACRDAERYRRRVRES